MYIQTSHKQNLPPLLVFFFFGYGKFFVSYIKNFCLYDCVDALITACLQNDVLVFVFLFSHYVHYQYSAIMINVGFSKPLTPLTPQPLSHALPSPLNFDYMPPFSFFLS